MTRIVPTSICHTRHGGRLRLTRPNITFNAEDHRFNILSSAGNEERLRDDGAICAEESLQELQGSSTGHGGLIRWTEALLPSTNPTNSNAAGTIREEDSGRIENASSTHIGDIDRISTMGHSGGAKARAEGEHF